jgi:hypothetical protein
LIVNSFFFSFLAVGSIHFWRVGGWGRATLFVSACSVLTDINVPRGHDVPSCASHWCCLRADHMLTVAASPLLSLSLSLSTSRSSIPCSQSPSSLSCTFSACPYHPPCLPLSAHFLNAVCMYPPAVCLYPLILSPLSLSIAVNPPALSLTLSACPFQSLS